MKIGLRLKWTLVVVLFIILIASSAYVVSVRQGVVMIRQELIDRGMILARGLAYNSEYGLFTKNKKILLNFLTGVMKVPDVSYCGVYDKTGHSLALAGNEEQATLWQIDMTGQKEEYNYVRFQGKGYFNIVIPVTVISSGRQEAEEGLFVSEEEWVEQETKPTQAPDLNKELALFGEESKPTKTIGFIQVGISEERAVKNIGKLRRKIAGVTGFIMLLGVLVTVFFVNRLIRPIQLLSQATHNVSEGDLSYHVDISRTDELGVLAGSFNKMTLDLKKSRDKLESYSKDLEVEVKERTKELQKAKENLEEIVEERTRELREAQEKVIRSERLAAIGQLSSSVAHELRNPLGVMKNVVYFLNMLEVGKDDPEIQENLGILSSEIEISNKVINDLLEFSRIKQPKKHPENINSIIKETMSRVKVTPDVEIVVTMDESLPDIPVDQIQLHQVFYNLATNAIQAMEEGGVLTVKTLVNNDTIEISFTDTGQGIDPKVREKIFDALFSTKAKGTGLGLSVCLSLVEGHEGRIDVDSQEGKGTTFTVKIPKEAKNG